MTEGALTYQPASYRRLLVDDSSLLPDAIRSLSGSDAIGVDLEMVQRPERKPGGLQEWVQVLALIQIASDTVSVVVDPVRCRDLSALRPLLRGETTKVFLGGGQDAALLERSNLPARHIADVGEVALAIFGRREDGMAALARRIFGLHLDKTVRRTDWLARPLNPVLLAYAHQDAELTLQIYRWFQLNYPDVLAAHERLEIDPVLPPTVAEWLRDAVKRTSQDLRVVLAEHGLDPASDRDSLVADTGVALKECRAPRQVNRVLRVVSELELSELLPTITMYLSSESSLIRTAAVRAVGQVADVEAGARVLEPMKSDVNEEVRKAVEQALKDLRRVKTEAATEKQDPDQPLTEGTLSALQDLMRQLQEESS